MKDKAKEKFKNEEHGCVAGNGKVLLMDDEALIRESVEEYLSMKGYEVETARNGNEAIEKYKRDIKTGPFDAVILDLTIRGGMGGKETVKKLLEIDPDTKAIVSSGYSSDVVIANFKKYGFIAVFDKGADSPEKLCKILQKVIKGETLS